MKRRGEGRHVVYGMGFVLALVAAIAACIAAFNQAFTSSVPLTLHSNRAGLLLDAGAAVKMRGVTIGRVDGVRTSPDGAVLHLAIDPDQLRLVPSDVTARIIPPTFFGGKYVELDAPAGDPSRPIAAGATIDASHVTVEINTTFEHLMQLLDAAKPAQVKAALNALATTLDGRGNELGQLITTVDTYLRGINPSLDTLRQDLTLGRSVLATYAKVAPDLLATAGNASVTGDAIENNRASLDAFLLSLTSVSRQTTAFVDQVQPQLVTTLDVMTPMETTLARYAPELPCFFQAMVKTGIPLDKAALGEKRPGLGVLAQFLPPQTPYKYSRDLPKIGADVGPRCYGMPNIPVGQQVPHQIFNVGPDPYANDAKQPGFTLKSLLELLFGPIQGALP